MLSRDGVASLTLPSLRDSRIIHRGTWDLRPRLAHVVAPRLWWSQAARSNAMQCMHKMRSALHNLRHFCSYFALTAVQLTEC